MTKEEICKKYGLNPKLTNVDKEGHFWLHKQSGKECITFEGVEIMIDKENIVFQKPDKNYSSNPNEVALLVSGHIQDDEIPHKIIWSFGEARAENCVGSYFWAMAEKRGKARVALKLLGIYGGSSGFYSDVEMEIAQKYENDNDHGL
tara:strand:+ start:303 stop:743 length:441 start_codon:yes stop_codon:yes gene_type:complete